MKMTKKITLVVCAMLILSILTGCINHLDASTYTKAILANTYKKDSSLAVKYNIYTYDEARIAFYEKVNDRASTFYNPDDPILDHLDIYRNFIISAYKATDYKVTNVEEKDGKYIVTVETRQLKIFGPASEAYAEAYSSFDISQYNSQEEVEIALVDLYLDSLIDSWKKYTYGDTVTKTITVEYKNNKFSANQSDLDDLENALIDFENALYI